MIQPKPGVPARDDDIETLGGEEQTLPVSELMPSRDAQIDQEEESVMRGERRASDRTSVHDPGSDANETIDGLNESDEALRHAAEDELKHRRPDDVPVFDRGDLPPKV